MKEVNKSKSKGKLQDINQNLEGPNLEEIGYDIKKDVPIKKKKKWLIVLFVFLALLVICFLVINLIKPKISLNGLKEVEISYGTTYIEEGATANHLKKDVSNKIKITNNIDIDKIGDYQVVYTLNSGFYKIKKIRNVKVVDKVKPVIELDGDIELNLCPNDKFKEIGYKAFDEYDGDITDKVVVTESNDKVVYMVKDSSGNSYSVDRKLIKNDTEAPSLTLKGIATMYLNLNETYTEPGYTASDNCSGDLTNKVIVTGTVNTSVEGIYKINYTVSDDSNNKVNKIREVIVSKKTNPNSGVVKNGTIYLTFDDGPSSITTPKILDILKEEGVQATFFVTNSGPDYLIKRMYDEGHTVALHTASHDYSKIYSSVENYYKDLNLVSDRVKRITGETSKIVRFPGGSSNTVSRKYNKGIMTTLSNSLLGQGYRYYDWNVDSCDASTSKTSQAVYNSVTRNLSKNRVNMVLMHDIKYQTRDALRDIIRYAKNNGYNFEKIDMNTYMVRQKINN